MYDATDGRDSTNNGIKELVQAWYLIRQKYKNDLWHRDMEYILYDTPQKENPSTDNPLTDNPTKDNTQINKKRNTKKEIQKKNNILSKDNTTEVVEYGNEDINSLIEHLQKSCSENWLIYSGKWKKERQACKRLLSEKFSDKISQFGMDLFTFVNNIIFVSTKVQYTTKQATSAYDIYYNWEHFVNLAQKQKQWTEQKQERHATFEGMEWAW